MSLDRARTPVILLAAGKSSRMGEPKGLLEHQGHVWLEEQLARLAAVGLRQAIVVLGSDLDAYFSRVAWLKGALASEPADACGMRVRAAVNQHPDLGQFSSLQTGAALVSADAPGSWVLPIDVPCPRSATWKELSEGDADACLPVFGGHGGHPVRLSPDFLRFLRSLPPAGPESRLDLQIHRLAPEKVERIQVTDPAVTQNINTPEDWARVPY